MIKYRVNFITYKLIVKIFNGEVFHKKEGFLKYYVKLSQNNIYQLQKLGFNLPLKKVEKS